MFDTPYRYVPGDRPEWVIGESPSSKWTQSVIRKLQSTYSLKVFIETGTCRGETLLGIYDAFEKCYTIELFWPNFVAARENLKDARNVTPYFGNSALMLPQILDQTPVEPTLFFLDAHASGENSADEGDPLGDEIRAILKYRPDAIIMVDDQHTPEFFDSNHSELTEQMKPYTRYWAANVQFFFKHPNV